MKQISGKPKPAGFDRMFCFRIDLFKGIYRTFPLHPSISMHILHTVLQTFPKVLTRRIVQQSRAYLIGDHFLYYQIELFYPKKFFFVTVFYFFPFSFFFIGLLYFVHFLFVVFRACFWKEPAGIETKWLCLNLSQKSYLILYLWYPLTNHV